MFCTRCGNEIQSGDAYCGNCGVPQVPGENVQKARQSLVESSAAQTSSNSAAKWILAIIGGIVAISLISLLFRGTSSSNDIGDMTKVLEVQRLVNTGGIPVAGRMLDLQDCYGSCQDEFRAFRESLIPYEVILADSVEKLNSVNAPQEYREFVTKYRDALQLRLGAIQLYIRAIHPSGRIARESDLLLADDKWTEAQRKQSELLRTIERIYQSGR